MCSHKNSKVFSGKKKIVLIVMVLDVHVFIVYLSYLFMSKCWHVDPNKRPTFSELVSLMSQILATLADYMDVFTFGEIEAHSKDLAGATEVTENTLM